MIGREHDEGPVGNDPVEMLSRHALGVRKDRVIRLLADQQPRARPRRRITSDRLFQRLKAMHTLKLQVVDLGRAGKEMHMRFDQAWQNRAALRIDDARRGLLVRQCRLRIAYEQNLIAGDRHGFRVRQGLIHRDDPSVGDDDVSTHAFVLSLVCKLRLSEGRR